MKTRWLTWTCAATLAAMGTVYPASVRAQSNAGDKAQIEALEHRFIEAVRAKDLDKIMAVYAPGSGLFVFDVTPPRQHVGWEDYRKDWKDLLDSVLGPLHAELTDLSVTTDGHLAFSHSIQRLYGTTAAGKSNDFTVRVTDAYEKIDGKWYIVQEHVSVPVDLDTGKPDMQSRP